MSQRQKRSLGALAALALAVGLAWAVVALARQGGAPDGRVDREVVLEARGMAFYLPGDPTPNPTLRFTAGERVRLTVVNRDPGLEHDLAIAALEVATPVLAGDRASASVVLRLPGAAGEHDYVCTLHPRLMRGRLVVR